MLFGYKERQMWVGRKDFTSLSDFGSVHTGFGRDSISMREVSQCKQAHRERAVRAEQAHTDPIDRARERERSCVEKLE
jgi:hypothetical protein